VSEINIVELTTTGGGAFIIGGLCGGAAKYLFRVLAFLAGLFIAITVYLDYIDFIGIKWKNIQEMIDLIIDSILILGIPEQESTSEVLNVFSIFVGFITGFAIGYRFG
jgi:uncharacterized membrane protein (Fun14 family)